jgi:hypothetical protein
MEMEVCSTRISLKFTPVRNELEPMSTELQPPDAIRFLLLNEPNLSVSEIGERLHRLGIEVPTGICIAQIKNHFRRSLNVIEQAGMLRSNRSPELPQELLRTPKKLPRGSLKKPRQKQLPRRYDQRHGYDELDD